MQDGYSSASLDDENVNPRAIYAASNLRESNSGGNAEWSWTRLCLGSS